jgi:hypothetical protein
MVVGRGARPRWRPSSWSGASLACSGRRRCPVVTRGRRKTRPRGRAGGEGARRRELAVAGTRGCLLAEESNGKGEEREAAALGNGGLDPS